jgi:tetratricopeptide (TPR) repeat protein
VLLLGLSAPLRAQPASPARPPVPSGTVALAVRVDSLDAAGGGATRSRRSRRWRGPRPDDATRLAQLGRWLSWSGDHARALDALGRAARLAPGDADVLTDYGVVLSWRPATRDSAERVLAQALAVDARHRAARVARADVLRWQGQGRAALAEYERVLALDPAYADALRGAAAVLAGWGDADGAAARLARLPDGAADLAPARVERARVAVLRNDAGTAAALLPRGDDLRVYGARALADSVDALVRPSLAVWAARAVAPASSTTPRRRWSCGCRSARGCAPRRRTRPPATTAWPALHGARRRRRARRRSRGAHARARGARRPHERGDARRAGARHARVAGVARGGERAARPRGGVRELGARRGDARGQRGAGAAHRRARGGRVARGARRRRRVGRGLGRRGHRERAARQHAPGRDVQVGKSLRAGSPYVRLAYGASWLSYDYDASVAPSVAAPRTAGGYFSPDRYQYHYAQLS